LIESIVSSFNEDVIMSDKHIQVSESHTTTFVTMVDTNTGKTVEGKANHVFQSKDDALTKAVSDAASKLNK
jgi:hypothetical protein